MKNLLKYHIENEEWLLDLFDNAHDLIQIVQLDGTLFYVNNAWANVLEFTKEEIIGKPIFSFIDEADRDRYRQYRNQVIDGVISDKEIVFNLQTKSGRKVSVEGTVSVKQKDGVPICTRGMFRDVTAKLQDEERLKSLNQELKARENNLLQLLHHAPDAVIVTDEESHILYWNPKAEEIFGWTAKEAKNKTLSETIIPVQHREAHEKGMKRYLATGVPHVLNKTIEISALNKNGEEFFVSLTISRTIQNGQLAFISFIRDISQQKKDQLELEQKSRELERSNASLQEFAYAASHDLKEPVRKINFYADRLKERLLDKLEPQDIASFNRMTNAAERMGALIDDLLNYSSISIGADLFEEVDLNQVIQRVQEDLEIDILQKQARVSVDVLPKIKAQERQIQQLFQNLISNAIKYSKEQEPPVVSIRSEKVKGSQVANKVTPEEALKEFILLTIKDNGIGFKQEDAEKIFNVFTRLHGSENQYRGTGIGLSIAQKVVENHRGHIWAESTPGVGTTFYILLPEE